MQLVEVLLVYMLSTVLSSCILSLQAYFGHCEALRLLCETLVSLDVRDIEGQTALHLAAQKGFSPCVEVLLKHQASYTLKEHKHKWTALHTAGVCISVHICAHTVMLKCVYLVFFSAPLMDLG